MSDPTTREAATLHEPSTGVPSDRVSKTVQPLTSTTHLDPPTKLEGVSRDTNPLLKSGTELRASPAIYSALATTWHARGGIYTAPPVTPFSPAVIDYEGQMILCYADMNGDLRSALGSSLELPSWTPHETIIMEGQPTNGPALAVLDQPVDNGNRFNVHLVCPTETDFYHVRLTETPDGNGGYTSGWQVLGTFQATSGQRTNSFKQPALIAYNGLLWCFFVAEGGTSLACCYWTPGNTANDLGTWSKPIVPAQGGSTTSLATNGVPAMYVLSDQMHLMFSTTTNTLTDNDFNCNTNFPIVAIGSPTRFNVVQNAPTGCSVVTDDDETALLAYMTAGGLVASRAQISSNGVIWQPPQLLNAASLSAPALAISDGVVNCIYRDFTTQDQIMVAEGTSPSDLKLSLSWMQTSAGPTPPLNAWMSAINDNIYWSQLCIPGTHDTAARGAVTPYTNTQSMDILEQLDAGIRFFDVRLAVDISTIPIGPKLMLHHGIIQLSHFSDMVQICTSWLEANKTETIFWLVKQEDDSDINQFNGLLNKVLQADSSFFSLANVVLPMGQLRGKIQLLHRQPTDPAVIPQCGIDLTGWPDNAHSPDDKIGPRNGYTFWIEDYYDLGGMQVDDILSAKWGTVQDALSRAQTRSGAAGADVSITYLSADGHPFANPELLAAGGALSLPPLGEVVHYNGMNSRLYGWMMTQLIFTQLGVIMMDFPTEPMADLIQAIILKNNFSRMS